MVKFRDIQDNDLRIHTETAKILFMFTERHLVYYVMLYFRAVLYEKVRA